MPTLQERVNFILGPQLPIGEGYFDRTQVSMAETLGASCPAIPPTDPSALNDYELHLQYYDLPKSIYIVHERTRNPLLLIHADKSAESWWQHPSWIREGTQRDFYNGRSASPRHGGIGGLILRALRGEVKYWDFILAYTQAHLNIWLLYRLKNEKIHVDVREGAFAFHYAVWLAYVLPDSYPLQSGGMATNGAEIRAQLHADLEKIVTDYYARLQKPCGCWVYDVHASDGQIYLGITQPFTLGLLLLAFADFHRITTNTGVRDKLQEMILKTARHLYNDGPYRKDDRAVYDSNVRLRFFWYTFHGGTAANPTEFEKGGHSWPGNTRDQIRDGRQSIGPVIGIYGYAYKVSNDPLFLEALREMWDSAYGDTDGIKTYFDTDGKGFNQHCARAGSALAWTGIANPARPALPPTLPQPPTEKPPMPTESPDNTKGATVTDSSGNVWTFGEKSGTGWLTLRNGVHADRGAGTTYKYVTKEVYVHGTDNPANWYRWGSNNRWQNFGLTEPGVVEQPPAPADPFVGLNWPTSAGEKLALLGKMKEQGYQFLLVQDGIAYFEKVG
jgi:hypothetical protein